MWAESQPGPSRAPPTRGRGYCGYCRVLYSNLDQHLSSLRHLDAVQTSSRETSTPKAGGARWSLLERFLSDVLEHHPHQDQDQDQDPHPHQDPDPHQDQDPGPSHPDLVPGPAPPGPAPPLPPGVTRLLPSSDDGSVQLANEGKRYSTDSQSGDGACQLSPPIREEEGPPDDPPPSSTDPAPLEQTPPPHSTTPHEQTPPPQDQAPPPQDQAPPPLHRKAHRKTNRRKGSDSSSSPGGRGTRPPQSPGTKTPQGSGPGPGPQDRPHSPGTRPPQSSQNRYQSPGPPGGRGTRPPQSPGPGPGSQKPWTSWQRERREAQKQETFCPDDLELLDDTIDEVIQTCCHGNQEDWDDLRLSVAMETQSEDWDVQVELPGGGASSPVRGNEGSGGSTGGLDGSAGSDVGSLQVDLPGGRASSPVRGNEGPDLSRLMEVQVDLEDQVYSHQLDRALRSEPRGARDQDQGFWTLPIEQVLPVPQHIPGSFRGKSWAEIEQEDEEKVNRLVQQFRKKNFPCFFDAEAQDRCGGRSPGGRSPGGRSPGGRSPELELDFSPLPLVEPDDIQPVRKRKRRSFRMASRCQVVKVSHGTQTVRLVVPAAPTPPEAPPPVIPSANRSAASRGRRLKTPELLSCRSLPSLYSSIVSPVQPRTSLVYLLVSPSGPAPATPSGPAPKRCRRRHRPVEARRFKLTYKPLPVQFYDPGTNRILKNPPKGVAPGKGTRGSGARGPGSGARDSGPPPCRRQLFRSLSPDLNTGRPPDQDLNTGRPPDQDLKGDAVGDAQTNEGRRRGRGKSQAPPPGRGRGGDRKRTTTRASIQATPPQPRRAGLRRKPAASSASSLPARRGRGRRGRGCKRR
ncbi:DBF4-type zinc finger-containing protein 2 [Cololabis saira]|uniref:DBF4-type zinc finger-containing protein 2 n=1 Tax=Cololabis saira TaxID=129043 RepID=UPI002AD5538B|nr:DBF4-type zinc finger-containing protein 2 [Cololabis saira]